MVEILSIYYPYTRSISNMIFSVVHGGSGSELELFIFPRKMGSQLELLRVSQPHDTESSWDSKLKYVEQWF
jgi:hypothetical protein